MLLTDKSRLNPVNCLEMVRPSVSSFNFKLDLVMVEHLRSKTKISGMWKYGSFESSIGNHPIDYLSIDNTSLLYVKSNSSEIHLTLRSSDFVDTASVDTYRTITQLQNHSSGDGDIGVWLRDHVDEQYEIYHLVNQEQ